MYWSSNAAAAVTHGCWWWQTFIKTAAWMWKQFFIFNPVWGRFPFLTSIFFKWVVKPPTRNQFFSFGCDLECWLIGWLKSFLKIHVRRFINDFPPQFHIDTLNIFCWKNIYFQFLVSIRQISAGSIDPFVFFVLNKSKFSKWEGFKV